MIKETVEAITQFEEKMKMILPPSKDDEGYGKVLFNV